MERWRWEPTARGAFQAQRSLDDARTRQRSFACVPMAPLYPFTQPMAPRHVAPVDPSYGRWTPRRHLGEKRRVCFLVARIGASRSGRTSGRFTPMNGTRVNLRVPGLGRTARKHPDGLREHGTPHALPAPAAGTRGSIAQRFRTSRPTRGGLPRSEASSGPHSGVVRRSTRPTHAHLHFPLQAETLATWTRPSLFA